LATATEGAPAPDFALSNANGDTVRLSDLRGRTVVLYFYPKDDTPGCTKEACGFRDNMARLTELGVTVLGVSPDSPESHRRFAAKYELPFDLLSDPDNAAATAYGVWVEKSMYGRTYMGIERSTFVIDGDGVLRKAFRKVKVPGHVDEVIAAVQAL
jgi:peroxiredoxin Q/BCP